MLFSLGPNTVHSSSNHRSIGTYTIHLLHTVTAEVVSAVTIGFDGEDRRQDIFLGQLSMMRGGPLTGATKLLYFIVCTFVIGIFDPRYDPARRHCGGFGETPLHLLRDCPRLGPRGPVDFPRSTTIGNCLYGDLG